MVHYNITPSPPPGWHVSLLQGYVYHQYLIWANDFKKCSKKTKKQQQQFVLAQEKLTDTTTLVINP